MGLRGRHADKLDRNRQKRSGLLGRGKRERGGKEKQSDKKANKSREMGRDLGWREGVD